MPTSSADRVTRSSTGGPAPAINHAPDVQKNPQETGKSPMSDPMAPPFSHATGPITGNAPSPRPELSGNGNGPMMNPADGGNGNATQMNASTGGNSNAALFPGNNQMGTVALPGVQGNSSNLTPPEGGMTRAV